MESADRPDPTQDLLPREHENFFRRLPPVPFVVLVLCLIFLLYQIGGGVATYLITGGMVTDENVSTSRTLTMLGQILLILVPTLVLARLRSSQKQNPFAVQLPSGGEVAATVVGVFALQQVLQGYMAVQEAIPVPDAVERLIGPIREMIEETYLLLVSANSTSEFLLVVLVIAVVPAVVEEMLFRGLIQKDLEKVGGGMKAAVTTGILFSVYHFNPFTVIPLAALGIYFGFLSYRAGNLFLAMVAHFTNNFLACFAVYSDLGEDFVALSPESQNQPALLAVNTLLFLFIFVLSVWYFVQTTSRRFQASSGKQLE